MKELITIQCPNWSCGALLRTSSDEYRCPLCRTLVVPKEKPARRQGDTCFLCNGVGFIKGERCGLCNGERVIAPLSSIAKELHHD